MKYYGSSPQTDSLPPRLNGGVQDMNFAAAHAVLARGSSGSRRPVQYRRNAAVDLHQEHSWLWFMHGACSRADYVSFHVAEGSLEINHPPPNPEEFPARAAAQARAVGFIPTTSGDATGHAPTISKIEAMGEGGALAIASGMTPENVNGYAPALSHILVATSVSRSEHHIDPAKLKALIGKLRGTAQALIERNDHAN